MRHPAAVVVAVAVLCSACAREDVGRSVPACDPSQITNTIILEAQSVPDVEYIPCVNDLKAGWSFEDVEAHSGRSRFWIDSDRVGERFLEVTLEASCELGGAVQVPSDEGFVPLFVEVERFDYALPVVVVPEGEGTENRAYALSLAEDLGTSIVRDRAVRVTVDAGDDPTEDRITRALESNAAVLVVGAREAEEGSVELYLPASEGEMVEPQRLSLRGALDEVEDTLGDPAYRATWHYLFRGGCVTYRFDASGPGIDSLPRDVQEAVGLYPVDPLRELGVEYGYVLP